MTMKLNLETMVLATKENQKLIKQAITTAYKVNELEVDIEFMKFELEEVLKHSIYNKIAEITNEMNKKAKKILKLVESTKENNVVFGIFEVVKGETFVGDLDWVYIANRNAEAIEEVLFKEFQKSL